MAKLDRRSFCRALAAIPFAVDGRAAEGPPAVQATPDEPPVMVAMPKNVYCVVGRESSIYYDAILQRDFRQTGFRSFWSAPVPAGSGAQEERIRLVPAAPGINNLTLQAFQGDNLTSTAVCAFSVVAADAAPGNKIVHCLGDSLIANGGMLNALRTISLEPRSTTQLTFIGTAGRAPILNDGYSGKPLGAFRGPTIAGANPFYNPVAHDFDYGYWMVNAGGAFPPADFVFIQGGGADVGAAKTDEGAWNAADVWAKSAEAIAASIRSANPTCKIVFTTKEAGPSPGEERAPVYGPAWRVRRNWRILAAMQINRFGNRQSDRIYVSPTAAAIDPEIGWVRTFMPRNAAVTRDMVNYDIYAVMAADLSRDAGTLAYAADVGAYFVKVGKAGLGRWRDADLRDGFIMRHIDTVHYGLGAIQVAEANWGVIKNFG
jgi:hypothetical protein